jgi:hypothetical protein
VQAKLDEARLLGADGFPALLKQTRGFVPKGKGHEVRVPRWVRVLAQLTRRSAPPQQADLNRLMSMYQFWAHRMYPKTQFRDTVKTVEKLCHSKRMHVSRCPLPSAPQCIIAATGGAQHLARRGEGPHERHGAAAGRGHGRRF